jgi:hypothetical protein
MDRPRQSAFGFFTHSFRAVKLILAASATFSIRKSAFAGPPGKCDNEGNSSQDQAL